MQSSVRSNSPRLVNARPSSPLADILPPAGAAPANHETSVISTGHKTSVKRASYSHMPPAARESSVDRSSAITLNRSNSQVPRYDSMSRASMRSFRAQSRSSVSYREGPDPVLLEENREGMKALADFLMTKEPPPSNWMSNPSDDEMNAQSLKKSAFRIFRRQSKKQAKPPRFIQLPDSAVAAKTSGGARHIAISIPLEHDYSIYSFPPQSHLLTAAREDSSESQNRTTVTVLKPVVEVPSPPLQRGFEAGAQQPRPISTATPPADILGPDAIRTLENYYTQLHRQQAQAKAEGKKPEAAQVHRSYVTVSPLDARPQDGRNSDLRHSGGTVYSTATMTSGPSHSRGVSSVSTAPSVNSNMKIDLPPRKSSRPIAPVSLEAELYESSRSANEQAKRDTLRRSTGTASLNSANESLHSVPSASQSPPTVFSTGTAETGQGYSSTSVQYVRTHTPKSSSLAPTKKLPDLPETVGAQITRPASVPLSKSKAVNTSAKRSSVGATDIDQFEKEATKNSRQERVKARKQRDIAAIRANSNVSPVATDGPATSEPPVIRPVSQVTVLPPSRVRSTTPQGSMTPKVLNTISPIMIVVDLLPYTGVVLASDLPSPPTKKGLLKAASSNSNNTSSQTPPHSMASSFGSDSDTIPRAESMTRSSHVGSPSRRSRSSVLDTRRQERRAKRNMSLHEKEMDVRLNKIEKDNAMLLNTLSTIANSFGELHTLMPRARVGRTTGLIESRAMVEGSGSHDLENDMI